MKIKKGDKLDEITLPKHDGNEFNLSETTFFAALYELKLSLGSLAPTR